MRAIERKVYILLTKEQFNNENFKINRNGSNCRNYEC